MSGSALTRPGERDRLIVKFAEIDWLLCGALCLLAGAGAIVLFSVVGGAWTYAGFHLGLFGALFIMMICLAMFDLRVWFALAYPLYGLGVLLLVAVALFGQERLGATRWLDPPGFPGNGFQPSEVMKLALVLALARYYHGLSAESARMSWRLLIPAGLILVPTALVMHQPDLGTGMLIAMTGAAIMVAAGLSWRIILPLLGAGLAALPPVFFFVLHDYQRERVMTLLNPGADASGSGYHVIQSMIALGSGGLLGRGFAMGSQSTGDFLPEKQTDFIFAALGEAFGFAGCVSVLFLFGAVIFMSLRTAAISHSHFGRLGALGVTTTFALYVLINGAMVMGLAPVVGVPMPLLSKGGTVLMTVMIGFGFIQAVRVHRYSEVTSGRGTLV